MLFDRHFDRPGPGVNTDEPRKKGIARFAELIGRDFVDYWKAGGLAMLCMLPGMLGVSISLAAGGLLPALLCGLIGGAIAAPCQTGLFDTVARTLRDEPGFWWHNYRTAVARNARAALVPGALVGLLTAASATLFYALLLNGGSPVLWGCAVLSLMLLAGGWAYYMLQLVLLDMPGGQLLRNTFLLWIGYLPRTFLAAAIQIVYWGGILLLSPYSLPVLLLTSAWLPVAGSALAIYAPLEKVFSVEENVRRLHERARAETEQDADR
jgi:hypothetical protein